MAWRLGYARQLGRPWLVREWYPDRWLLSAFLVLAAIGAGLLLREGWRRGALDFMHRGIGFFRGYGIRVFLSIQSLEQLFQIYGQHQSIGANCGVQVAYGANDVATAKLLSEMTGRRTVEYWRKSRDGGFFGGRRSEGEVEAGRPLLSADEVRRLPEGEALVYVAGCAPIRGARVPYWRDAEMARRAGVVAPAGSDRVPALRKT